jgi:hypothetical protein
MYWVWILAGSYGAKSKIHIYSRNRTPLEPNAIQIYFRREGHMGQIQHIMLETEHGSDRAPCKFIFMLEAESNTHYLVNTSDIMVTD